MGVPGYTNSLRTDQEKKNDKELDRAYQSTVKGTSDAKKRTLIRGAMFVELHQRQHLRTNSSECHRPVASRRLGHLRILPSL
jgi:uncharacterized protein YecT (DUF1311 family)